MKLGNALARKSDVNLQSFIKGFAKVGTQQKLKDSYNIKPDIKNKKRINKTKGGRKSKNNTWILSDGLPYLVRDVDKDNNIGKELIESSEGKQGGKRYYVKGGLEVDGIHSFRIAKHPIRNRSRPQKFSKPSIYSTNFYQNFKEIFNEYEIDVDKCVVVNGCWTTNKHTLQKQLIPRITNEFSALPNKRTLRKLEKAAKTVLRKLKIETLPACNMEDMLFTHYNKDTYPGFTYSEYGLAHTKSECLEAAFKVAQARWKRIEKGDFSRNEIFPSLYTIGARNKRDYSYDEYETASSRVVHMPEFHAELTSGPWTDQITDWFKEKQKGPVFIGNSYLSYERLEQAFECTTRVFEGDWKNFDASLYINMIILAVSILRCFYSIDDAIVDEHFKAIFDCVGIKDYYLPGGDVIRAAHGLPSGVKSTNLIGTIINLLALAYCTSNLNSKRINFIAGGDDFDIACFHAKVHIKRFIKNFEERASYLGMQVKFLKAKMNEGRRIEDLPCFYKYVVIDKSPAIPTSAMLERTFMPWNRNYQSDLDLLKFLEDVMPSLGQPRSHLLLYYMFYAYIYTKIFQTDKSTADVISYHVAIYNNMMNRKEIPYRNRESMNFSLPICGLARSSLPKEEVKLLNNIFKYLS